MICMQKKIPRGLRMIDQVKKKYFPAFESHLAYDARYIYITWWAELSTGWKLSFLFWKLIDHLNNTKSLKLKD